MPPRRSSAGPRRCPRSGGARSPGCARPWPAHLQASGPGEVLPGGGEVDRWPPGASPRWRCTLPRLSSTVPTGSPSARSRSTALAKASMARSTSPVRMQRRPSWDQTSPRVSLAEVRLLEQAGTALTARHRIAGLGLDVRPGQVDPGLQVCFVGRALARSSSDRARTKAPRLTASLACWCSSSAPSMCTSWTGSVRVRVQWPDEPDLRVENLRGWQGGPCWSQGRPPDALNQDTFAQIA